MGDPWNTYAAHQTADRILRKNVPDVPVLRTYRRRRFSTERIGMAKRRMHGTWILYLIPPFLVAYGLVWLMRDVWNWF